MIHNLLQYGWQYAHLLTIEGVVVAWGEMPNIPLPTGFTSLAVDASGKGTLVIDESAEFGQMIDRSTGIGAGYPLTFKLADNTDLSFLRRKQTKDAVLTANVGAGDAVIDVSSAQNWSGGAGGVVYIGTERIEYAADTIVAGVTTQFTGCTRATGGGRPQSHLAGQPGSHCSDVPNYWRGREVRLYSQPVSPAGVVSTAADEQVEIWRGQVDNGPDREAGFWKFEALSLDRRLTAALPPAITGTIFSVSDKFEVQQNWSATIEIYGYLANAVSWHSVISVNPFVGFVGVLSSAEIFNMFKAAFDVALAVDPGLVGGGAANFIYTVGAAINDKIYKEPNFLYLIAKVDAATDTLVISTSGTGFASGGILYNFFGGVPDFTTPATEWKWDAAGNMFGSPSSYAQVLSLMLDKAPDFLVPAMGWAFMGEPSAGNVNMIGRYLSTQTVGPIVDLWNFIAAGQSVDLNQEMVGQKCSIIGASFVGTPGLTMRECLEGSRTPALMGPDDLGEGGYTIDVSAIDLPSFDAFDGFVGALQLTADSAGSDFAELFGGLLALCQHGICARQVTLPTGEIRVQLSIVTTNPAGSDPVATLLDDHLLTAAGWPITPQLKRGIPNVILLTQSQGSDVIAKTSAFDPSIALGQGGTSLEFDIPADATQIETVAGLLALAGQSLLRQAQSLQIVEILCVPWFYDVRIGDLIAIVSKDPTLWQYTTGTAGYTGNARIIGVKRHAVTGALTMTAILDGQNDTGNLSPAARVSAFDNDANPTWIEVLDPDALWFAYFSACLASSSPFRLLHYQPGGGAEVDTEGYQISTVSSVAGSCRLAVAAKIGVPVLSTTARSTLTLPESADCNTKQALYSHAADGTKWA